MILNYQQTFTIDKIHNKLGNKNRKNQKRKGVDPQKRKRKKKIMKAKIV